MRFTLKKFKLQKILPWFLVIILALYSLIVTIDRKDYLTRLKALEKNFATKSNQATAKPVTAQLYPEETAKPLIDPYQGSLEVEQQIWDDIGNEGVEIKIINTIGDYVYITEHSLPPGGGGGWGVVKKENGKWEYVFLSQDEVFCTLYEKYNLPKWLLGECAI